MAHRTEFKIECKEDPIFIDESEELTSSLTLLYPNNPNFYSIFTSRNSLTESPSSLHARTLLAPFDVLLAQFVEKLIKEPNVNLTAAYKSIEKQLEENLISIHSEKERKIVESYIVVRKQNAISQHVLKKRESTKYFTPMAQILQVDEMDLEKLINLTSPPPEEIFELSEEERVFSAQWKEVFDWATLQKAEVVRALAIYRIKIIFEKFKFAGIPLCSGAFLAQQSNQALLSLNEFIREFIDTIFGTDCFKYGHDGVGSFDPALVSIPFRDAGRFFQQIIISLHDYRNIPTAPETILGLLSKIIFSFNWDSRSFNIPLHRQVQIVDSILSNKYAFQICQRINEKLDQGSKTSGKRMYISDDLINSGIAEVMGSIKETTQHLTSLYTVLKPLVIDYSLGEKIKWNSSAYSGLFNPPVTKSEKDLKKASSVIPKVSLFKRKARFPEAVPQRITYKNC